MQTIEKKPDRIAWLFIISLSFSKTSKDYPDKEAEKKIPPRPFSLFSFTSFTLYNFCNICNEPF